MCYNYFMVCIGNDWDELLREEFTKEYYLKLRAFLKQEYSSRTIYPDMYHIFHALQAKVKIRIESQRIFIIHSFGTGSYLQFLLPHAKINRYSNDRYSF